MIIGLGSERKNWHRNVRSCGQGRVAQPCLLSDMTGSKRVDLNPPIRRVAVGCRIPLLWKGAILRGRDLHEINSRAPFGGSPPAQNLAPAPVHALSVAALLLQQGEAGLQSSVREPRFSWAFSPGLIPSTSNRSSIAAGTCSAVASARQPFSRRAGLPCLPCVFEGHLACDLHPPYASNSRK